MIDLYLSLRARSPIRLPVSHGQQAHAAFLDLIGQSNLALASRLHAGDQRQPFAVSLIRPTKLLIDDTAIWRLRLLDDALLSPLANALLPTHRIPKIVIGDACFELEEFSLPCRITIDDLWQYWCNYPGDIPRRISLRFLSPTTLYAHKDGQRAPVLHPEPRIIWHGLRRLWGDMGGFDVGIEHSEWIEAHVSVVRSNIRSCNTPLADRAQKGFVGTATFEAFDKDRRMLALWQALTDFAILAGIGMGRTMGFGEVRRCRERTSLEARFLDEAIRHS